MNPRIRHKGYGALDKNRFEGSARELGGKLQSAFGDAFGSDKNAAEGRLRQAEGAAQDLYGQGREALRDASHYASDLYENAGAYAERGSKVVRHKVHQNPLSALLVAGLIGFVLGLIARDRD